MSETENQNAQQDVAPVHAENDTGQDKEQREPHPTRKRSHKRQHSSHAGRWILLLSIAIVAGAGWYGFEWFKQSQAQLAALQNRQADLAGQNEKLAQQFNDKLSAMAASQKELTKYVEVIRDKDQHLRKDWLVMEAEYLIQLANYRLLFERDINTAIVALNSADVRIKDAGDPALINVRKAIANAIQSLKQIEQADLAGLSLTLSAINKDLAALPLNTPDPVTKAHEVNADLSESKKVTAWSDLPAAIWRDLKNLIVIREHDTPVGPLLSPEQRFFLVENLRLQIEQARLAMLAGQSAVYKERIQTAMQWIEKHFDPEAALTKSTLDTLQQLSNAAIAPELPDISSAYQVLQKYRANTGQDKDASVGVKPAPDSSGTN